MNGLVPNNKILLKGNLICLLVLGALLNTGCSEVSIETRVTPSDSPQVLTFGGPEYTFSALGTGHALYPIGKSVELEDLLAERTKFRVVSSQADSSTVRSEWIATKGFELGKVKLILNTVFDPQTCNYGDDSKVSLVIETEAGFASRVVFSAPNGCKLTTVNVVSR